MDEMLSSSRSGPGQVRSRSRSFLGQGAGQGSSLKQTQHSSINVDICISKLDICMSRLDTCMSRLDIPMSVLTMLVLCKLVLRRGGSERNKVV